MKKLRYSIILFVMAFGAVSASSQTLTGVLVNSSQFLEADMLQYSQYNYGFTSARASAMGGAFTSLGGDIATIGINPAGLGMYRRSVLTFSPSLTTSDMRSDYTGSGANTTFTRFAPNNIGGVFNLMRNSKGTTALNFGISYNKIADYNYRGTVDIPGGKSSLGDVFTLQLNGLHSNWEGIDTYKLDHSPFYSNDIYVNEWGAVLGYLGGAINPVPGNDSNPLYELSTIDPSTEIAKRMTYDSRGSIGEYNFAIALNAGSVFYLGATLGIQDIYHNVDINYSEDYPDTYISGNPSYYLRRMGYDQHYTVSGSSANIKVGAIIRPFSGLRLGIAYHSPSYVSMERSYQAGMNTQFHGNTPSARNTTSQTYYDYYFNTPGRLLTGISYTFGSIAAVSFDYERVWYDAMRLTNDDYDVISDYGTVIKRDFRPANNFRAGLEVKPTPAFAIRAGYAFYDSPLRKSPEGYDYIQSRFIQTTSHNISAGVGFWLGTGTTLDIAYIYSRNNYAPVDLFYFSGDGRIAGENGSEQFVNFDSNPITAGEVTGVSQDRHTVTMSFNFMF